MAKFARKRFDAKIARKIFFFALTWIFFIYIGVLWGQLNMLSAFLTFLAFYAITSKRTLAGAVTFGNSRYFENLPVDSFASISDFHLEKSEAKVRQENSGFAHLRFQ